MDYGATRPSVIPLVRRPTKGAWNPENDCNKKEKNAWGSGKRSKELFVDFAQGTTLHGMRQVTEGGVSTFRRVLWLGLLLACVAVFGLYAYERIRTYRRYDVNINVQYDYIDSIEFPAVTICNTNTFKLSKSVEYGFFKDVQEIMDFRKELKGMKQCVQHVQFECQPGECVSKERLCDFFPDCSNQADEKPELCEGKCQIVCVDSVFSPSERALNLEGRCFMYDRALESLYSLQNQAFLSQAANENQTDLYLFYDGARWVMAEEIYSCDNCSLTGYEHIVVAYWPTSQDRLIFNQWHRWATDPVRVESNVNSTDNSSTTVIPTTEPTTLLATTANRRDRCRTTTSEPSTATTESVGSSSASTEGVNSTTVTTDADSLTATLDVMTRTDGTTELDDDCLEPEDAIPNMDEGPGIKVGLMLSCHAPSIDNPQIEDVLEKLQPNRYRANRTLAELYEMTAPQLRDTLMRCTWRGEPCSHLNFTAKYTDMGLCFTFISSQSATLPGPGYGLGLTLNIEQYDYTSNADDGVGIRVLLHDDKDEPVMDQKSFAISPGLYTLVSVERTEVNALPDPWGYCVDKELKYYNVYSMATCRLECENAVIRRECHCRDIYMPAIGEEPVCDIATYLSCGRRAIEINRKFRDECRKCESPCREEKYVPSMSFSAISTRQDNLGPTMTDLKLRIAAKVQEAREYTYRLNADKYRESQRMFSSVANGVSNVRTLLEAVLEALASDRDEVRMRVAEVKTDCVWFSSGQDELVHVLQDDVLRAGLSYQDYVKNNVLSPLRGLINALSLRMNETNRRQEREWGVVIKDKLYDFTSGLKRALRYEIPHIVSRIWKTSTELPLSLESSQIEPLLSHSKVKCLACLGYENTLLNGSNTGLLEFLRDEATPDLHRMQEILNSDEMEIEIELEEEEDPSDPDTVASSSENVTSIPESTVTTEAYGSVENVTDSSEVEKQFVQKWEKLESDLKRHLVRMEKHFVEPTRMVLNFAQELTGLTATKCGSELQRPLEGYMDSHARMQMVLIGMLDRFDNYGKAFGEASKAYEEVKMSLARMAKEVSLSVLADDLENDLVTLNGLLDQRNIGLSRIAQYINVINYWFSAQTPAETLRDNSKFWASLGLWNPRMVKPRRQSPQLVADSEEYVIADQRIDSYWKKLSNNLEECGKRSEDAVSSFELEISPAKSYMEGYLRGNELEESFLGDNVLQLEIFYKELAERNVEESEAYRYPALLSEIGGLMGLLLGGSLMTMVEFVELLIFLCVHRCLSKRKVSGVTVVKAANADAERR